MTELVCPSGTIQSLKTAIKAGADAVYVGFDNKTNARNFPGLNFTQDELLEAVKYARKKGRKIMVAINTYPQVGEVGLWHEAVDNAYNAGVDAVIMCDIGLLEYTYNKYPDLRIHLSVQASASCVETINFYKNAFNIKRVIFPRVLTLDKIKEIIPQIGVETEIFVYGGMCVMAEGRCALSYHLTGRSPNCNGVCSPADAVEYAQDGDDTLIKLGGNIINRIGKGESIGYPTACKGRYIVNDEEVYAFEKPISLNAIELMDDIIGAGITAVKIEGRQRGKYYIENAVSVFRKAIDGKVDINALDKLSEGGETTKGAFLEEWR